MNTVHEIATELANRFEKNPERWIKGSSTTDKDGINLKFGNPNMWCGCVLNHLLSLELPDALGISFQKDLISILKKYYPRSGMILDWNDHPGRSIEDVIDTLKKVANVAELNQR